MNKNYDYEVKKMYYCRYDCPLRKKLPKLIEEEVGAEIDCIEDNEDIKTRDAINYKEEYEYSIDENDICKNLCPIDGFISQL